MTSLPKDWNTLTLGETCNILAGFGFPKRLQGKESGDIPFFKVGDISECWKRGETNLTRAKHYLSRSESIQIRAKPLPASTTVFAKIGAAIALNRRAILSEPSLVDNNVMGLYPASTSLDYKFLFHFICTVKLDELSRATTVPSVRKSDIEQIKIPVPPIAKQKELVAEIEKQFTRLDAGVKALKRVQANLKRYRASVLKAACEGRLVPAEHELARKEGRSYETGEELLTRILSERRQKLQGRGKYTEPIAPDKTSIEKLPEGWTWATFDQTAERVTVGFVGSMKHEYVENGVPFLRSQNVRENRFDPEGLLYVSRGFHQQLSKSALQSGDLAVVRSGSVGVTCVIPDSLPEANCSDLVLVQRPLGFIPQYGAYYMNSLAKRHVAAGKVGVALIHFNTKSVAALAVPLPPLAEQKRIIAEVERRLSVIDELEAVVSANLQRATRLRQAILHKSFSGKE